MELLEAFYRRKLKKKQKKAEAGRSDGALCRSPSESSVNSVATSLISKVLRFTSRRTDPASRPHSWHSTKLCEGKQELNPRPMDTMSSSWHHNSHTSASTIDLSGGFDSGGSYLRKSPDQYSSRGSMESLDPPLSSQLHSGTQQHRILGHHGHSGPHPAYSSCHQLSSARSSNSIDHLHSKRDSAYSSFSTSSSIPEYLAFTPSFSSERSYSLETVPQRGEGSREMQQADTRYVQTVYDYQQAPTQRPELSSTSAALHHNSESRHSGAVRPAPNQDEQGSTGGVCYRGSCGSNSHGNAPASNRHSVGSVWGPATSCSFSEILKEAPAPPRRSDSYAAIRSHERPNSWSSLEHTRSLRSLQKSSWHHCSGPVASGSGKGSYSTEGQLHTVIEKSPESSPTTKPRQGGGFFQPLTPPGLGPVGSTPQSSRIVLPLSMHPVLHPETHYAQTSGTNSGPSKVYSGLAKESRLHQQQGLPVVGGREGDATQGESDGRSSIENGFSHSFISTMASTQLRTQAHELERHQQDKTHCGPLSPHLKSPGSGSEGHTRVLRPPHDQGSSSQSFQDPHLYTSQGPQDPDLCPGYQEHNQHFNLQLHAAAELRMMSSPEQGAPSSPVEPWVPPSRSGDQNISHSEPLAHCRPAHGLMPRTHLPTQLQPHTKPVSTIQTSSRHFSDSAAMQHQHWDPRDQDREHPLTRLENALAEVQQCSGPDAVDCASSRDRGGFSESCRGPVRSLSVLEKVSRLERQEHARKQRSQSTSTSFNKPPHLPNGRSSPCGAEDLRHMLERSTKSAKVHRMMSLQGGSCEQAKHRTPADPSSALQRSRSTYQVAESTERDGSRDVPGRHHIQELLGPIQDIPYIRNSLKDTQSAAPCSISFRQRDLRSSVSDPPAAPPPLSSTSSHRPPPVPAKYQSLEKKGPKTMPKPQGVIITPQSIPPITSPHTPKERHVVSPDVRGLSPPTLPSVPPVGPPALPRICGRRRLTADQKKRCYSEPENMNEVGVSDPETVALFRHGGETSVADRRKMFEFAANRVGGSTWRPDLRQLQQDALVQYFERKRAGGRTEGGRRTGSRPRSAYLLPENCNYTDSCSLSSASSLLSLQDAGLQSNLFYPGRVTTPRLPPHPLTGPTPDLQAHNEPAPLPVKSSQCQSPSSHLGLGPAMQRPQAEASVPRPMTPQLRGALLRAGSASAESLLDGPQERVLCVQHQRSRSSPSAERLNQDLVPGDGGMFGVFRLCVDRSADVHVEGGPASPEPAHISVNDTPPAGSSQGSSHTPVTPRERQRTSERQRAHSTAALAASVGLPCPFSPPGTTDGVSMEWQASERLSQANLDAITFPQISTGDSKDPSAGPPVNSDTSMDIYRDRAISLGTGRSHAAENTIPGAVAETPPSHSQPEALASTDDGRKTSSSPSLSHPSLSQLLVSLQGSESGHNHSTDQQLPLEQSIDMPMQEDYDDVFLHSPCPPSLLLLQETMITGDFPPPPPPPPPPVVFEQVADSSIPIINHFLQSSPASSSPSGPSSVSSIKPQVTIITASKTAEDHLGLEYQPVPKREKMSEEQRVETLAQELVLQDPSLAPILDTRGWRSTVDLIDLIFPNCKLNIRSQHRVDGSVPVQSKEPAGGREADTGEDQKDLTTTKVKLCEALRSSMAALQREKEALCEEQRSHQMLGASIQTLVQELLKPNERDKFCMLIGDLDKIVNLLLSLCSRLSRIERSLLSLQRSQLSAEDAAEERESLDHKRSVVLRQTEDACELKENLDRRQCVVHAILRGYLTEPQLKDYCHFVRTEPSLLICQRRLDDLMRLEEEQLAHLVESLPVEVAEAHGRWAAATAPPFLGSTVPCSSPSSLPPAASTTMGDVHPIRSTTVTSL